jgi:hypothetical protein
LEIQLSKDNFLFDALDAIDRRDKNWINNKDAKQLATIASPVFLRYVSSINNNNIAEEVLLFVNENMNDRMWNFASEHPELLYKIATLTGTGRRGGYHTWIPGPKKHKFPEEISNILEQLYSTANNNEIRLLLKLHSREEFSKLLEQTGTQVSEAKEVMKAYDKYIEATSGKAEEKPAKSTKRSK